ncbi:hypothetical protein [Streptomyces sp. NPDC058294]|uniref:hypothetical protein n=1 Tax=Streptomyces sp. NPDC058294 TaxID=3346430 RepID=UPI0036EBF79C
MGVAVLAVVPVALAFSDAFYRNVVLYPFGLGPTASSAQSPLLGHLIAVLVPHGDAVTMALIALSAAGVGLSLVIRPALQFAFTFNCRWWDGMVGAAAGQRCGPNHAIGLHIRRRQR